MDATVKETPSDVPSMDDGEVSMDTVREILDVLGWRCDATNLDPPCDHPEKDACVSSYYKAWKTTFLPLRCGCDCHEK